MREPAKGKINAPLHKLPLFIPSWLWHALLLSRDLLPAVTRPTLMLLFQHWRRSRAWVDKQRDPMDAEAFPAASQVGACEVGLQRTNTRLGASNFVVQIVLHAALHVVMSQVGAICSLEISHLSQNLGTHQMLGSGALAATGELLNQLRSAHVRFRIRVPCVVPSVCTGVCSTEHNTTSVNTKQVVFRISLTAEQIERAFSVVTFVALSFPFVASYILVSCASPSIGAVVCSTEHSTARVKRMRNSSMLVKRRTNCKRRMSSFPSILEATTVDRRVS